MMKKKCWIVFLVIFSMMSPNVAENEFPALDHIQTVTDKGIQASTVKHMVERLVADRAKDFTVTVDPSLGPDHKSTFKLVSSGGLLSVTGNTGVAAAWGFYYYLSQYCGCHISWAGNQVSLPDSLPAVPQPGVVITSNDRFRYYQNVCTVSYSFAWWDWARWERELDWMAMNGINLPLAFNAQEAIWQRVYLKMGFTQTELDRHFGGPAFLAWSRMGNIHGWGGPLTEPWHHQQLSLQHRILRRMRDFGMTPVLPAFAGHVPASITKHFPNATVSRLSCWSHFNETYSATYLLDVSDAMFPAIGKAFITEYIQEFGTDHIYNTDTFNEMIPKSSSPAYLREAGRAVYSAMLAGDSKAIWLMQGWLFTDTLFWGEPQAKALLTSVPTGKMIVLDLFSEVMPFYDKFDSYYGQPFVWCMLHNFGGTLPMYGVVENVNQEPFRARMFPNSSMVGIGLTPEGINQNNAIYEFMIENSWRKQPRKIAAWASNYALRRYGEASSYTSEASSYTSEASSYTSEAWQVLMRTVYNCTDSAKHHNKNILIRRPSEKLEEDLWYNPLEFFEAWDRMIKASHTIKANTLFRYDLVDVTRQALQVMVIPRYTQMISAYRKHQIQPFRTSSTALLELLSDLDDVLATDEHFLLGRWLEQAENVSTTDAERTLYEYNARAQITTWGPEGEILDYANKQWAGLVRCYYRPRWKLFVAQMDKSLSQGTTFNQSAFNEDVFTLVEKPFTLGNEVFPTEPIGDQIKQSQMVYKKYQPLTSVYRQSHQTISNWTKHRKRSGM